MQGVAYSVSFWILVIRTLRLEMTTIRKALNPNDLGFSTSGSGGML